MSIFVRELVDGVLALEQQAMFTRDGRRHEFPQRVREERIRKYVRAGGIEDLAALVREAQRLAEDLRLRTGVDHSDPVWAEAAACLHPYQEHSVREGFVHEHVTTLIPSIAAQIEGMEDELIGLAPRAA